MFVSYHSVSLLFSSAPCAEATKSFITSVVVGKDVFVRSVLQNQTSFSAVLSPLAFSLFANILFNSLYIASDHSFC